jgi:hypothetical protein
MPNKSACPNKVKIGFQEYLIVQHDVKADPLLTEGNYGYTQDARNIIVIDQDLHESKKKVTVFHEVMHAARFIFANEKPKKTADYEELEHHFIALWENSLLMVLQDNPELTDWLLGE